MKNIVAIPYYIAYKIVKKSDPRIPTDLYKCSPNSYYLAIWKCATNTIRKIIKENYKLKKMPLWKPKKLNKKVKNSYIFTTIRNPYSRVLSVYLDKTKKQSKFQYTYTYRGSLKDISGKNISFEQFVKRVVKTSDEQLDPHLKPYSEFLKYVPHLDFAIKLENFKEDWNYIAKKINYPKAKKIKTSNKNKKGYKLEDYYTPELKELVYQKYKKDFEKFGYKK